MSFRVIKNLALSNLLVLSQLAGHQTLAAPAAPSSNKTIDLVACGNSPTVPVLSSNLTKVLFQVPKLASIKVFQGWEQSKKVVMIKGAPSTFLKVQIPASSGNAFDGVGWIAEQSAVEIKKCVVPLAGGVPAMLQPIKGLTDPRCCEFPLAKKPTESFLTGMRAFGAGRAGNRVHGAVDLYGKSKDPILAVTGGKIIRPHYAFYQGTYAIDVKHDGGFVVRYGEINGTVAKNTALNQTIQPKQVVGYMGKVNSNCCEPMLHFELYSGNGKGNLNQRRATKYQRRADIMNPTPYMLLWQRKVL